MGRAAVGGKWQRGPRVIGKKGRFPAFLVGVSLTVGIGADIDVIDSNMWFKHLTRFKERKVVED
ncbi:hypothetical protein HMPREF2875_01380 [Corynebacterium sp. HMSC078H07]|nr:hypothetical protein HMPREF2875_01380 [Corynebacterium sp. HMSC078H07]